LPLLLLASCIFLSGHFAFFPSFFRSSYQSHQICVKSFLDSCYLKLELVHQLVLVQSVIGGCAFTHWLLQKQAFSGVTHLSTAHQAEFHRFLAVTVKVCYYFCLKYFIAVNFHGAALMIRTIALFQQVKYLKVL
jgi:hypothetical protein